MKYSIALLSLLMLTPTAHAGCLIKASGSKCVTARIGPVTPEDTATLETTVSGAKFLRVTPSTPPIAVGDTLPDKYQVLMAIDFYGLPPVEPGWKYYRTDRNVYRVENTTRKVLEDVTSQTNGAFP